MQDAIQDLLTPLIRSLGSSHGKLLMLLRTFSPGAESLALRVLKILTEHGRPSGPLVALVKGLISERDLDARFLVPIVAELDRSEIERQLPRIMNLLSGKPEERDLVRSVFLAIVEPPSQGFGTSSTNLPRVRESELLKPVELLMFLHETDKGVKTKCAMEGIYRDSVSGRMTLTPSSTQESTFVSASLSYSLRKCSLWGCSRLWTSLRCLCYLCERSVALVSIS